MNDCIQIGLATTNYLPNGTATTVFSNVSYTQQSLQMNFLHEGQAAPADGIPQPEADFSVFPNPTNGALSLDLTDYIGRSVRIETYSLEGRLLQFTELNEVQTNLERLDINRFENGMYLVKVRSASLPDVTKRVVLQRQ